MNRGAKMLKQNAGTPQWEADRATKAIDELGALKIEVAALREDRERLDWLDHHGVDYHAVDLLGADRGQVR